MAEEDPSRTPNPENPVSLGEASVSPEQARQSLIRRAARFARGLASMRRLRTSQKAGESPAVFFDEDEEILEDSIDPEEPNLPDDPLIEFLLKEGVGQTETEAICQLFSQTKTELTDGYLQQGVGLSPDLSFRIAQLLIPVNIYLKRLHDLGMPSSEDEKTHNILINEVGRLRLLHLSQLVGGHEEELRELMGTEHSKLLAEELNEMGLDERLVGEIIKTSQLSRDELIRVSLREHGIDGAKIDGVLLAAALSEVPREIASAAENSKIPLGTVVRAREAFKKAGWRETLDYLELAKSDSRVRELLSRDHGIEIVPTSEDVQLSEKAEETDEQISKKEHPFWELNRQGQAHGLEVVRLTEEIAKTPLKTWRELKSITLPIPLVSNIQRRLLARKMFGYHKSNRPKTIEVKQPDGSTVEQKAYYDDGLFGLGAKQKRLYRSFIKELEKDILTERSKLAPWNAHELKLLISDRRTLAERILALKSMRNAVLQGRLIPEEFYDHSRFENLVKSYEGHPGELVEGDIF